MGSPFLGDFEGVDKETGKLMFSLEANNFVDEVRIDAFVLEYDIWFIGSYPCISLFGRREIVSKLRHHTLRMDGWMKRI
jgi:hypothetical protein